MGSDLRQDRPKVVVAGFWAAGASIADGFVQRNARIIEALRSRYDVLAIALASPGSEEAPDYDLRIDERRDSEVGGRRDRVRRALKVTLGRLGLNRQERQLRHEVRSARPDVIIALLRRRPELVDAVADLAPTAFFSEEHVAHWNSPARSGVPPVISTLLRRGRRRAARQASVAVVLSQAEVPVTKRVLGLETIVVPHAFDLGYWAQPATPAIDAGPLDVIMVANCMLERSAVGVSEIIDELTLLGWPAGMRLRIVSQPGYLPVLKERSSDHVDLMGAVTDLRPLYASAVCTVVPDFEAKGVKNGIVQGWATRTPVVAAMPSAATVGGVDGEDLLIGGSPRELARLLASIAERDDLAALAAVGFAHLHERFSNEEHDRALFELVDRLAASRG